MVLFFTGTGNSSYIAGEMADQLRQKVISINEKLRNSDYTVQGNQDLLIFVLPTYCYRIPRVVEDWIRRTEFRKGAKTYFVMDCGESNGNAGKYLKTLCEEKGLTYMGVSAIVMPENYTAMYKTPDREESLRIIEKSESDIGWDIELIRAGQAFPAVKIPLLEKLASGAVNSLFYRFLVKDRKFHTEDSCTGCGKCAQLCPLSNITIEQGRPQWHGNCTHCMACINHCPSEAIEYGKKSKDRNRYTCPK